MALTLAPTTELEAVNMMLLTISEQPVETLESLTLSEASIARDLLHEVNRTVQSKGWNFNTEEEYLLRRDVDGYINLPINVLKVDAFRTDLNVVQRGLRLYDKENHTYVFTQDVNADIVLFLPFEELPQTFRTYIMVKAARQFQAKIIGSELAHKLSEEDEQQAWAAAHTEEMESRDSTIFGDYNSAAAVSLYRNRYR